MAFLVIDELKTVSVPAVVQKVINGDADIVAIVIKESIAVMVDCLHQRYDTEAIFNAEDDERNLVVLKHLKNIVINEVYNRKTNSVNEITQIGYDEAMSWLEKVCMGKMPTTLPLQNSGDDGTAGGTGDGFIKYGGNTRYNSNF